MTVRRYRDDSDSFKEPSEESHSVPSTIFELFQKQVADDKTAKKAMMDSICVRTVSTEFIPKETATPKEANRSGTGRILLKISS